MTARAFLVRGLIAGLIAGIATFLVAYSVGEPHIDTAVALEESHGRAGHGHGAAGGHPHSDTAEDAVVSRDNQKTWGLLTGTLAIGLALGGIVALVAAGTVGRIGRLLPGQSTALITLAGFVSFALVPFLKYPPIPPGVGSGDTIGDRTALYFGFVLFSVVVAALATYAAVRLGSAVGTYWSFVIGAAGYLVAVVIAGQVFGSVVEVGDFPADALWQFRRAALFTHATMWAVIGVVLTWLVSRLHAREQAREAAEAERREFAASL